MIQSKNHLTRTPRCLPLLRHPQLRCLISSPYPDILYYASDADIYRLSLRNKKQELIATLPFSPRCLAAAHGWLCIGGQDNGSLATIQIQPPERFHFDGIPVSTPDDLDALLPEGLDPMLRRQTQGMLTSSGPGNRRSPLVRTHELGDMIVNSVTLYHSSFEDLGEKEGTIAILT